VSIVVAVAAVVTVAKQNVFSFKLNNFVFVFVVAKVRFGYIFYYLKCKFPETTSILSGFQT